jgi:hypothetical protein
MIAILALVYSAEAMLRPSECLEDAADENVSNTEENWDVALAASDCRIGVGVP